MADHQVTVDKECEQIKLDIKRIGAKGADGKHVVKFGVLFDDEVVEQYYEALVGTLKAAKKKKFIDFEGMMLLKVSMCFFFCCSSPYYILKIHNSTRLQWSAKKKALHVPPGSISTKHAHIRTSTHIQGAHDDVEIKLLVDN